MAYLEREPVMSSLCGITAPFAKLQHRVAQGFLRLKLGARVRSYLAPHRGQRGRNATAKARVGNNEHADA
jgi:hypothetical protein